MPKFLIDNIFEEECRITGQDAKHISKVLRLKPGDCLTLTDGSGKDFEAVIQRISPSRVSLKIGLERDSVSESPVRITLCQGVLKDKKMDGLLRHVTELGIYEWWPFFSERSVPVLNPGKKNLRRQRWESIAKEALKQCERSRTPIIHFPGTFNDIMAHSLSMDLKIIFWENLKAGKNLLKSIQNQQGEITSVMILVGPEGGFSNTEIQTATRHGFIPCGMGPRILRAQTASIAACTLVQSLYGDM